MTAPLLLEPLEAWFERALSLAPGPRETLLSEADLEPQQRAALASLLARAEAADRFFESLSAALSDTPPGGGASPHLPSPSYPLGVGESIAQYRTERVLGAGGMGVVYLARDTRLGRAVALKLLPSDLAADPVAVQRFLQEARAAASLDHPHVCALHEVGQDPEGRLYLAMGYYGGETLDRTLERGPLPAEEALRIARAVADALATAHQHRIVHRDVKPANILLTEDGDVKLLDFGLAKLGDTSLTVTGRRMGTPAYMSPEQALGDAITPASDWWALGAVLYEMLTGDRPFRGQRRALVKPARNGQPVPPSRLRAGLDPAVDRLVLRLLSPDPDRRTEGARWLSDGDRGMALAARGAAMHRRRWARVAVGLAALGAAAALVALRGVAPGGLDLRSIAVLPLTDSALAQEERHLAAGLHEGLIRELEEVPGLRVIVSSSVLAMDASPGNAMAAAGELGVEAILAGTLTREADSLDLELRLLDGSTGVSLWEASLREPAIRPLALSRHARDEITRALDLDPLPGASRSPGLPGPAAQEAYLRGVSDLRRQATLMSRGEMREVLQSAVRSLEEAVRLDPAWAEAHAKLATAYHWLAGGDPESSATLYAMSRAAALRSIALDDTSAEAFAALGYVLYRHDRDWVGADRATQRAVALGDGHYPHWTRALYLLAVGRAEEALEHLEEAERRDPLSHRLKWQIAVAHRCAGHHENAVRQMEELRSWYQEESPDLHHSLGYAYSAAGRHAEARAALELAVAMSESRPAYVAGLAYVLARAGQEREARDKVRWLDERYPQWPGAAPETLAALGDTARVIALLRQVHREAPGALLGFRCNPAYPYLRGHPALVAIERDLGLPAPPG